MKKNIIKSKITGDSYVCVKHDSGLEVLICPMEGFSTTEALFGTRYGSINTMFKTKNDKEYTEVPEGIAHFLEHKLFENEDTDVFELYAKTGASANAYTSFDKTCYLFSCSDNYKESLEILLSFVQKPYFTQETVDKEQGIIGQEIKMCNDNPNWKVFFNALKCMYHKHPVKIDIAGTIESIAQIDADLLYKCYNTFYNLHNMTLAIAGNVDIDEVLKLVDKYCKPSENLELETVFYPESDEIVQSEMVEIQPVGTPLFNIGFKNKAEDGFALSKVEMEAYIAINVLADQSSPLYNELLEEGLVNSTFENEIFCGNGYFSTIIGGESKNPRQVLSRIIDAVEQAKVNGLDRERFEMIKKSAYGHLIRQFNNVEAVASSMINSHFSGVKAYDGIDILSEMTYDDIQRFMVERMDTSKVVLSIVQPEN